MVGFCYLSFYYNSVFFFFFIGYVNVYNGYFYLFFFYNNDYFGYFDCMGGGIYINICLVYVVFWYFIFFNVYIYIRYFVFLGLVYIVIDQID